MSDLVPVSRNLELLHTARQAVEQARTVDDVKHVRDSAEALRVYAKQAGESLAIQNECAEIKLRAERRAGELIAAQEKHPGGRPSAETGSTVLPVSPPQKLAELGIDKTQSSRWQSIASLPAEDFEQHVEQTKARGEELTSASVLRLARKANRPEPAPVELPEGSYSVLYVDPPWRYDHIATPDMRAVENQYPTMTLDELKALPVPAADDAVLFMWATSPKLAEAVDLMDVWDFDYRTCAVWVKDRIGMGYYFRQQHELLLVGRRGEGPVPVETARPSSVVNAPRGQHSAKPIEVYDLIERMYPGIAKVELFARTRRDGWDAWGNQADTEVAA